MTTPLLRVVERPSAVITTSFGRIEASMSVMNHSQRGTGKTTKE